MSTVHLEPTVSAMEKAKAIRANPGLLEHPAPLQPVVQKKNLDIGEIFGRPHAKANESFNSTV